MNFLTRVFLVLLRLAIGWHILFEGIDKLESHFGNRRDAKAPWTSEKYLLEAQGPLGPIFREKAGDPHKTALDRLTLVQQDGKAPQLPPVLDAEWNAYFDRFVRHYGVGNEKAVQPEMLRVFATSPHGGFPAAVPFEAVYWSHYGDKPDKIQLAATKAAFDQAKQMALEWLLRGEREVQRSFSKVNEMVRETTPERIQAYRAKVAELRAIEQSGFERFGKDVWKKNLTALKSEVERMRSELMTDLNRPITETMEFAVKGRLTSGQRALGPVPAAEERTELWWIDRITMFGLTAVGACLLLGFFTRTACFAGAVFLLMFYVAMPALPWLPAPARAEGLYVFINKNVIEMLALLTLATTASGRWVGLDGLFYWWWPERLQTPRNPAISQGNGPPAPRSRPESVTTASPSPRQT